MTVDLPAFRLEHTAPGAPSTSVSGPVERLRIVPRIAPLVNRSTAGPEHVSPSRDGNGVA
jgi:hypothetical protein